jgi:hypothetical protein
VCGFLLQWEIKWRVLSEAAKYRALHPSTEDECYSHGRRMMMEMESFRERYLQAGRPMTMTYECVVAYFQYLTS